MKSLWYFWPLLAVLTSAVSPPAWAQHVISAGAIDCLSCGPNCAPLCGSVKHPCPPKFLHIQEGPPKLKLQHGCPRPVCDPCNLPHYGYFQTCWAPWPYPDNWNHCPTPTPSQMLPPPEKPLFAPRVAVPVRPKKPGKQLDDPPPLEPPTDPPVKPKLPEIPPLPLPKAFEEEKKPSVRLIYPNG
ncbi:MAG: hypothetical protein SNJ75_18775 [Gemmataceae bacterium]